MIRDVPQALYLKNSNKVNMEYSFIKNLKRGKFITLEFASTS